MVTSAGYTEGVCFPIDIDDEGESPTGEPEVVVSTLSYAAVQYHVVKVVTNRFGRDTTIFFRL